METIKIELNLTPKQILTEMQVDGDTVALVNVSRAVTVLAKYGMLSETGLQVWKAIEQKARGKKIIKINGKDNSVINHVDVTTSEEIEPKKKKAKLTKEQVDANRGIWEAYKGAFIERYDVEPIHNSRIAAMVSSLRKALGADEAPEVAKFYLTIDDPWLLRERHPFGALISKAESYHASWKKGEALTSSQAHRQANLSEQKKILSEVKNGGF